MLGDYTTNHFQIFQISLQKWKRLKWAYNCFLLTDLKIGITLANFQMSGKTPDSMAEL